MGRSQLRDPHILGTEYLSICDTFNLFCVNLKCFLLEYMRSIFNDICLYRFGTC